MDTMSGVAITGAALGNSLSAYSTDPFYPKAWSTHTTIEKEMVDLCLGHPQETGIYHYHTAPACAGDSTITNNGGCASNSVCNLNMGTYMTNAFATNTT